MTAEADRVRFVHHKGKKILIQDFSALKPGPEFYRLVEQARVLIAAEPYRSVLTVVDATGSEFDSGVLQTLKEFVKVNTPYIKKTAVVGITGLKEVGLLAVSRGLGRPLDTCGTLQEALDMLAGVE
ncbi:MAG: hypothetical protein QUS35_10820 [bacterium]|nr:hypothetical protein [bacterium]